MKIIKFRGKTADGVVLYGDVKTGVENYCMYDAEEQGWIEVEELAQLVCYDADGKEVYEGDTIISDRLGRTPHTAQLSDRVGGKLVRIGDTVKSHRLKK